MESIFNFLLSYFSIIFLANVKSEISIVKKGKFRITFIIFGWLCLKMGMRP